MAPSSWVRATKWLLYQKAVAKSLCTAGTMVMSLAQSPGKINIVSMLFLELDINVSVPYVHCYSWDKEKLAYKVLIDLRSQSTERATEYSGGIHLLFISLDLDAFPAQHWEKCRGTTMWPRKRVIKPGREFVSRVMAHWMLSCISSQYLFSS